MKQLVAILLLIASASAFSQTNLIPGVQKQYSIAGRNCIIYTPSDTSSFKKYSLLVSFVGNSANDSASVVNQGPAKRIRLSTTGIHRDSFLVVTIIRASGENGGTTASSLVDQILDTIYKYNKFFDTSRSHMTGLSQGCQEVYRYLSGASFRLTGYQPKHQAWFKNQVYNSPGATDWTDYNYFRVTNTWVSWGTADAVTGTYWPWEIHDKFLNTYGYVVPKTKKIEISGAGHDATVWDSTWSLSGSTASNNVWMWLLSVTYGMSNANPTADAGLTQTLDLGTTSTTVNGSASYDADGSIASYSWSFITGSGTITSPSSASTTVTGLLNGRYRLRLVVTDNLGATGSDTISIIITGPRYKLSLGGGNMFRNGGRSSAVPIQNLLDGDTTNNACPLGYATGGIDLPFTGIIKLDSVYQNITMSMRNLSGGGSDVFTYWFYNDFKTDSIPVTVQSTTNGWKYLDSNVTKGIHFPVRWVIWRTSICMANVSEFNIYGRAVDTAHRIFPNPVPPPILPFNEFVGTAINGDEPDTLFNSVGSVRQFFGHWYIDSSATFNQSARNFIFSFWGNQPFQALLRSAGLKVYYTMFSAIRAFHSPVPSSPLNYNSFDDNTKNMPIGADSVSPAAWIACAQNAYAITLWGGRNSSGSYGPHSATSGGSAAGKGLNYFDGYEEGNESNASWSTKRYQDSRVRMAKQSAVYDAHMGTLGSYMGVKVADPTMKVGIGAHVNIDSMVIKTDALYNYWLRGYNNQAYDYLAVNQYFTGTGEQAFSTPSPNGSSPGVFRWHEKAVALVDIMRRYMPGVEIDISEFGWDKNGNTSYSALAHGSLDSEVVQANNIHLAFQIGREAGITSMKQYRSRDEGVLENSGDFVTSGQSSGWPSYTRWAANYWMSTMKTRLSGYGSVLPLMVLNGDSTGLYILKYEAPLNDTVTIVLQSGAYNDATFNTTIDVGSSTWVRKINMLKGDKDGVETMLTPSGGSVSLAGVGETPVYVQYIRTSLTPGRIRWSRRLVN